MKYRFTLLLISCISSYALAQTTADLQLLQQAVSAQQLRQTVEKLVSFGTRHTLSDTTGARRGIGAARRWAYQQFKSYSPRLQVSFDAFTVEPDGRRIPHKVEMKNVMAWLPGTDTGDRRVILITAHLDSRASDVMDATIDAPGANDDGSGCALVMEAARVLSQYEFPCSLLFVLFSGEEQGLYGSRHLAQKARQEDWEIVAVLNNDIVGNSYSSELGIRQNTRVRVFSEGIPAAADEQTVRLLRLLGYENESSSRQLARYMADIARKHIPHLEVRMVYRKDRFLRGGDHTPFNEAGFTAIRVCEENEDFTHQHQNVRTEKGIRYGDLPEFMDFDYLRKNTVLNVLTAAALAWAPAAPQNVSMSVSGLSNHTELRWQAPVAGPRPAYYRVLIRSTEAPQWEQHIDTKDTAIRLPYSKDHYLFAVQSVSEAGFAGLPVAPLPARE